VPGVGVLEASDDSRGLAKKTDEQVKKMAIGRVKAMGRLGATTMMTMVPGAEGQRGGHRNSHAVTVVKAEMQYYTEVFIDAVEPVWYWTNMAVFIMMMAALAWIFWLAAHEAVKKMKGLVRPTTHVEVQTDAMVIEATPPETVVVTGSGEKFHRDKDCRHVRAARTQVLVRGPCADCYPRHNEGLRSA